VKPSLASLLDGVRKRLEVLESSLPKRVDAMAVSPTSKLPLKALLYREALIWRMAELSRAAFESFQNDQLVSAIVLTRAAVETSAALWYLCAKVVATVESNAVGDIDEYLMKLVMGTATDAPTTVPRPVRVGAFLKEAEKDIEGFTYQYGILSEYAHPNWAGTSLLYSKSDKETRVTDFGRNIRQADNAKRMGLHSLRGALAMFERSYNRIADFIPAFTALSESACSDSIGGQR